MVADPLATLYLDKLTVTVSSTGSIQLEAGNLWITDGTFILTRKAGSVNVFTQPAVSEFGLTPTGRDDAVCVSASHDVADSVQMPISRAFENATSHTSKRNGTTFACTKVGLPQLVPVEVDSNAFLTVNNIYDDASSGDDGGSLDVPLNKTSSAGGALSAAQFIALDIALMAVLVTSLV